MDGFFIPILVVVVQRRTWRKPKEEMCDQYTMFMLYVRFDLKKKLGAKISMKWNFG